MKRHTAPFVENLRGGVINADRFWAKIKRGRGCWPWIGKQRIGHYGSALVRVRSLRGVAWRWEIASRVAYELTYGDLELTDNVLHLCANPPCCRPDHLRKGTQRDNSIQMVQHGHAALAKLTPDIVRDIRKRYAEDPKLTILDLAKQYGVAYQTVHKIVLGQTWTFVGGPRSKRWRRWGDRPGRASWIWKIEGGPKQTIRKPAQPRRSKLTPYQVRAIRRKTGGLTIQGLADKYGISSRHVSLIRSGKSWAHLT